MPKSDSVWFTLEGLAIWLSSPGDGPVFDGRDNMRLCGVVLLENDGGSLKATRIVDYFRDQRELDIAFGWGLQWTSGRKD